MTGYHNVYKKAHYMNFIIKDVELLETYKSNWNKMKNIIENDFSTQSINIEIYLETKLKVYNGEIHKKFCINSDKLIKNLKEYKTNFPFSYYCIPTIVIQSVFQIRKQNGDRHYPQINLVECIYAKRKTEKSKIRKKLVVPD